MRFVFKVPRLSIAGSRWRLSRSLRGCGHSKDPPALESLGTAAGLSAAESITSQTRGLRGHVVTWTGSASVSFHRFGLLGRCPGLQWLEPRFFSAFQYSCACLPASFRFIAGPLELPFRDLWSHSLIPPFHSRLIGSLQALYAVFQLR